MLLRYLSERYSPSGSHCEQEELLSSETVINSMTKELSFVRSELLAARANHQDLKTENIRFQSLSTRAQSDFETLKLEHQTALHEMRSDLQRVNESNASKDVEIHELMKKYEDLKRDFDAAHLNEMALQNELTRKDGVISRYERQHGIGLNVLNFCNLSFHLTLLH
jgi:chromosome segregation ATPase